MRIKFLLLFYSHRFSFNFENVFQDFSSKAHFKAKFDFSTWNNFQWIWSICFTLAKLYHFGCRSFVLIWQNCFQFSLGIILLLILTECFVSMSHELLHSLFIADLKEKLFSLYLKWFKLFSLFLKWFLSLYLKWFLSMNELHLNEL